MNDMSTHSSMAGMMAVVLITILLCFLLLIVSMWKVYTKAGQPGWAVLIPLYSNFVMFDIIGRKWSRIFVYLIPIYNIIAIIQDVNRLSKSFGKPTSFTAGLVILPIIFYTILAFGSATYIGPNGAPKAAIA